MIMRFEVFNDIPVSFSGLVEVFPSQPLLRRWERLLSRFLLSYDVKSRILTVSGPKKRNISVFIEYFRPAVPENELALDFHESIAKNNAQLEFAIDDAFGGNEGTNSPLQK